MSEPIKVGDLVVVVRADCEHEAKSLGRVFTVPALRFDNSHCPKCWHEYQKQWHVVSPRDPNKGFPITHVKRIPPLSELESEKRDEEITV